MIYKKYKATKIIWYCDYIGFYEPLDIKSYSMNKEGISMTNNCADIKKVKLEYNYNQRVYNKDFYDLLIKNKTCDCCRYITPAYSINNILSLKKTEIFKIIDQNDSDLVYQYVFNKKAIADAYIYLAKNKTQLLPQFNDKIKRVLKINPMDYPYYIYTDSK